MPLNEFLTHQDTHTFGEGGDRGQVPLKQTKRTDYTANCQLANSNTGHAIVLYDADTASANTPDRLYGQLVSAVWREVISLN